MAFLSLPDFAALAFFVVAWAAYAGVIEWSEHGRRGLNAEMDTYREGWMRQMLARQSLGALRHDRRGAYRDVAAPTRLARPPRDRTLRFPLTARETIR